MHYLTLETRNRVAYITLNRPEKRNAFSRELVAELKSAFMSAEYNNEVKAIVLRAEGSVFCAGADLDYLRSLQTANYDENLEDSTFLKHLYLLIYRLPKPVIAEVQGHALAGGCGLLSVCDFVVSVPDAKFGYTEVKIGFVPAIVMVFLLRRIGESRAKNLLLSGDLIDAGTALSYGLIHEIVPADTLRKRVDELAQHLCNTNSGQAMGATKQMIANIQEMNLSDALQHAAEVNARARAFDDCKKGINAFLNKEKLAW
jgi:methylglutaconyl-CoA hydratase